jgi:hypothetical protein
VACPFGFLIRRYPLSSLVLRSAMDLLSADDRDILNRHIVGGETFESLSKQLGATADCATYAIPAGPAAAPLNPA